MPDRPQVAAAKASGVPVQTAVAESVDGVQQAIRPARLQSQVGVRVACAGEGDTPGRLA
jgi:hypothetical protein